MTKLTPERETALKTWVYKVWPKHWKELAPVSNSRAGLLNYVLRDNPDDGLLNKIELAIEAQAKYWRLKKKADGKVIGIPCLSTWYNQKKYTDEFIEESSIDLNQRIQAKKCTQCQNDTHGENYSVCIDHLPNTSHITESMKKESLKSCGYWKRSDETVKEWQHRCRMSLKGKSGNVFKKMDF